MKRTITNVFTQLLKRCTQFMSVELSNNIYGELHVTLNK